LFVNAIKKKKKKKKKKKTYKALANESMSIVNIPEEEAVNVQIN